MSKQYYIKIDFLSMQICIKKKQDINVTI